MQKWFIALALVIACEAVAQQAPTRKQNTIVSAAKPRTLQGWEKDNVQTAVTGLEGDLKTCEEMKGRDDRNIEGEVVLQMARTGGDRADVERKVRADWGNKFVRTCAESTKSQKMGLVKNLLSQTENTALSADAKDYGAAWMAAMDQVGTPSYDSARSRFYEVKNRLLLQLSMQ